MSTLDFELEIGPGVAGTYPVVARAPGGEVSTSMRLPLTPVELDYQIAMVRGAVLASSAVRRRAPTTDEEPVRELGQRLFEALIADDVRGLYVASRQRARERGSTLRLRTALAGLQRDGLVELSWVTGQTYADLEDALDQGPWHVFHFVGHGGYDLIADEGTIALADDAGRAHPVGADDISRLLAEHHPLRLVVLNACDTARGSTADAFSSTAAALIRREIPAVVAMQFEITDSAAIRFAQTFYQHVAKRRPVDDSVMRARRELRLAKKDTLEWGTPVLYLRAPDGRIFDATIPPLPRPVPSPDSVPTPTKAPTPPTPTDRDLPDPPQSKRRRMFAVVGSAAVAVLVAGLLVLISWLSGGEETNPAATQSAPPQRATVLVSASASLTDVLTALEQPFEQANPGADLHFNFGSSSALAQQIVNGAPSDVFASANEKQLSVVSDAGLTDGPGQIFATNMLTIVVPLGNPKGIASFADLAGPDVTEVVCAPQLPCGSATQKIESATGTQLSPASEEADVRAVLAKVIAGEADAGLVYVTDAVSAKGQVEQINFAEAGTAINKYPITSLKNAPQPQYAQAFVNFVLGPQGKQTLADAGFGQA